MKCLGYDGPYEPSAISTLEESPEHEELAQDVEHSHLSQQSTVPQFNSILAGGQSQLLPGFLLPAVRYRLTL